MPQLLEHQAQLLLPQGQAQSLTATLGSLKLELCWEGPGPGPEWAMLRLRWEGPHQLRQLRQGRELPDDEHEGLADGGLLLPLKVGEDALRFDPDGPSSHSLVLEAAWQPGGLALKLHEQAVRF